MRTLILAASLLTLAGPLTPLVPTVAAENTEQPRVPLGSWHGRPTVDLTIAGEGPFRFILDTGADVTVIDRGLAARFELKTLGQTEIGSPLGGTVPATRLELPNVQLDDVELGAIEALDMDLAAVIGSGDSPVGVLSTSDFGKRSLIFDFARDRLTVSDTLLPTANNADVHDFCLDGAKPSLVVQVAGHNHCAVLDTGAPSVLSLPLSTAEDLPLASQPTVRGRARLVGAEVDVWGARLDGDLRVGEVIMGNPELGFMETAPYGNLGQEFLRRIELTVDHTNRRLRVRAEGNAVETATATSSSGPRQVRRIGPPAGKKRYGIRLRGGIDAELKIAGVEPGSPAEEGGLLAGDLILALNGRPVEELDTGERMSALLGSPLNMSVKRNGELQEITLRLE